MHREFAGDALANDFAIAVRFLQLLKDSVAIMELADCLLGGPDYRFRRNLLEEARFEWRGWHRTLWLRVVRRWASSRLSRIASL